MVTDSPDSQTRVSSNFVSSAPSGTGSVALDRTRAYRPWRWIVGSGSIVRRDRGILGTSPTAANAYRPAPPSANSLCHFGLSFLAVRK